MADGHQSADEVKAEHLAKLGPELGAVYHALWNDVVHLRSKWSEFVTLFGTSPERIDVLNKAAPSFFGTMQGLLFDDALLHIARLTGAETTMGKGNLTIRRLPALISNAQVRAQVDALVKVACRTAEFAHDWRNRRIAHTDLALATDQGAMPLKSASRKLVNNTLVAIEAVLKAVAQHYMQTEIAFDHVIMGGGAEQLLYLLDEAVTVRAARHDRIEAGTYTPEDIKALHPRRSL